MFNSAWEQGFLKSFPSAADILSAYDKHIYSVEQALQMLGVSRPTFFRRLKAWRDTGRVPPHGNNGHTPSNKISDETRQRVIQLVQTKYPDFQASLLTKYLREQEDIHVSVEWVRRLLLELHPEQTPKERRRAAIHCVGAELAWRACTDRWKPALLVPWRRGAPHFNRLYRRRYERASQCLLQSNRRHGSVRQRA